MLILVSEARVTDDVLDCEIEIEGYRTLRCDSSSRHTGGVVIYVRRDCQFRVHKVLTIDRLSWCLFVKLKLGSEVLLVGCLYRSPSSGIREFFNYFENWAEDVFDSQNRCILVGDFNLDLLKVGVTNVDYFKAYISSIGVEQVITRPTRITDSSETLIDYVLTNIFNVNHNVHDTPKITDHNVISLSVRSMPRVFQHVMKSYGHFIETNLFSICSELITYDWHLSRYTTDVDFLYSEIFENITSCVNNVVPLRTFLAKVMIICLGGIGMLSFPLELVRYGT